MSVSFRVLSSARAAGDYRLARGQRFEGAFARGRVVEGSVGTWTETNGGRLRVVVRRATLVCDLRILYICMYMM